MALSLPPFVMKHEWHAIRRTGRVAVMVPLLLTSAAFAACTPRTQAFRLNDLRASCWRVEIAGDSQFTRLEDLLPPLVRLDPDLISGGSTRRMRISEMPGSLPSVHQFASWRRISTDSVEMAWSTGYQGWTLRMEIAGDELRGMAEELDDAGKGVIREAAALRLDCDISIPDEFQRQHPPLPPIPVGAAGMELRIGARFGSEWPPRIPFHDRTFLVEAPAAGVYAGADSVIVAVDSDGRIAGMRLSYPDRSTEARILEHLNSIYGPPDRKLLYDNIGRVSVERASWINRELWIRYSTRGSGFELTIADPKAPS